MKTWEEIENIVNALNKTRKELDCKVNEKLAVQLDSFIETVNQINEKCTDKVSQIFYIFNTLKKIKFNPYGINNNFMINEINCSSHESLDNDFGFNDMEKVSLCCGYKYPGPVFIPCSSKSLVFHVDSSIYKDYLQLLKNEYKNQDVEDGDAAVFLKVIKDSGLFNIKNPKIVENIGQLYSYSKSFLSHLDNFYNNYIKYAESYTDDIFIKNYIDFCKIF